MSFSGFAYPIGGESASCAWVLAAAGACYTRGSGRDILDINHSGKQEAALKQICGAMSIALQQ
jgi:hypothetical protein